MNKVILGRQYPGLELVMARPELQGEAHGFYNLSFHSSCPPMWNS